MTPTVTTDVEVANLALDMVKEAPITSMDDNRAAAKWMKRNFIPARNFMLNKQSWKFAMKRDELAEDATAPAFEWTRRYKKPADCFRVLPLRFEGKLNGRLVPHQVEGDYILTNAAAPLRVRYIKTIDNVAEWPAHFVEAMATMLAFRISSYLTGKMAMAEALKQEYATAMQVALSMDASEGTHEQQVANTYDDARFYYSGLQEY
jgi:hypothetical protein